MSGKSPIRSSLETNALLDTTRLLIEPNELDFVLNNLLLILMGKLMISKAAIFFHEPYHQNYTLAKVKGRTGLDASKGYLLPSFEDAPADCFYIQDHPNLSVDSDLSENGLFLFCPLKTSELHLGYVVLGKKIGNQDFSSDELKVLQGICAIASAGVANGRLFNELKRINRQLDRKVHELNTLFDLGQEFSATVDRNQIIRTFKFALLGQMMVNKFFFAYRRADSINLVAKSGMKHEPQDSELETLFTFEGETVPVNDEVLAKLPFLEHCGIALLVNLYLGDEKAAVIGVGKRVSGEPFEKTDFSFLLSLGNLALMSVQKTYLLEERVERKRLEEEIKVAREIQEGLLPNKFPELERIDIAALNIPSRQVGGDYFDLITREQELILAIADVTGKGIPASLLMANLQSMLHALTMDQYDLRDVTGRINEILYRNTPADKFITFFWGRLNPKELTFEFVNAGHNPPMLFSGGEEPEELRDGGLLLGAMPTMMPYNSNEIQLQPGDLLVFFTDGVTEAERKDGSQYEEERLIKCINSVRDRSAKEILNRLIDDIREFTGGHYTDDVTVIILKVIPG